MVTSDQIEAARKKLEELKATREPLGETEAEKKALGAIETTRKVLESRGGQKAVETFDSTIKAFTSEPKPSPTTGGGQFPPREAPEVTEPVSPDVVARQVEAELHGKEERLKELESAAQQDPQAYARYKKYYEEQYLPTYKRAEIVHGRAVEQEWAKFESELRAAGLTESEIKAIKTNFDYIKSKSRTPAEFNAKWSEYLKQWAPVITQRKGEKTQFTGLGISLTEPLSREQMQQSVTTVFEGKTPAWAENIWQPLGSQPTVPAVWTPGGLSTQEGYQQLREWYARRHLKSLLNIATTPGLTEAESVSIIKEGMIQPSEFASAYRPAAEKVPMWVIEPGAEERARSMIQLSEERLNELLAYAGTAWYGVKKSPIGQIPFIGEIATGFVRGAEPFGKGLAELMTSRQLGITTPAERVGGLWEAPGGRPGAQLPGITPLEFGGEMLFWSGAFSGLMKVAQLGYRGATFGIRTGARGTGIITKPLRALTRKVGPAAEAELAYTEFRLTKLGTSVKGAVRGVFTTEPFYYYPPTSKSSSELWSQMQTAWGKMKTRLGIPNLPTVVEVSAKPGRLSHYGFGGLVKYKYTKPAANIKGFWDVPITGYGKVSPLPGELVFVRDSKRVLTGLDITLEKGGLREVQAWYKLTPTGEVKPMYFWDYMKSLKKVSGETASLTRWSGFEQSIGRKVGTGHYWSLTRTGVTPGEIELARYGLQFRGNIFLETLSRVGPSEFMLGEEWVKYAATLQKDIVQIGTIATKAGGKTPIFTGGGRGYVDKLRDFLSYGRFRVGVSGGGESVGDGVLSGYGQFAGMRQKLLFTQEASSLEMAWGKFYFPAESQIWRSLAGAGAGIGAGLGAGIGATIDVDIGIGAGVKQPTRLSVQQSPRIGQTPSLSLISMQTPLSRSGVVQTQTIAQTQALGLKLMQQLKQPFPTQPFRPIILSPWLKEEEKLIRKVRPRGEKRWGYKEFKHPLGNILELFLGRPKKRKNGEKEEEPLIKPIVFRQSKKKRKGKK